MPLNTSIKRIEFGKYLERKIVLFLNY